MIELPTTPTTFPQAVQNLRVNAVDWNDQVIWARQRLVKEGLVNGIGALESLDSSRIPLLASLTQVMQSEGRPTASTDLTRTSFLREAVSLLQRSVARTNGTLNPGLDLAGAREQAELGIRFIDALADPRTAPYMPF